jgi:CBS domain containing-hemolysin-like protein
VRDRGALDEALRQMQEQNLPAAGVVGADGRLVGLITPENIGEMLMVQAARPASRPGPWGPATPRGTV